MQSDQRIFSPAAVRGHSAETIALTVRDYDLAVSNPAVIGTRIDTGEVIRLALSQAPQRQDSPTTYRRPEIIEFASPRTRPEQPGTDPGGVLLAPSAYRLEDGTWECAWIQSLSHHPGEADVFIAPCSVIASKPGRATQDFPNGTPNFMIQYLTSGNFDAASSLTLQRLDIVPPFAVHTPDDLLEAGKHLLASEIGFGIRLSNPFDATVVYARPIARPDGTVLKPQDVLDQIVRGVREHVPDMSSQSCLCEVIPFNVAWAGAATARHFATHSQARKRLTPFNTFPTDPGAPSRRPEPHFSPAVVAVRLSNDGKARPFVTHVEPLRGHKALPSLQQAVLYARTDAFSPSLPVDDASVGQPRNARAEGNAHETTRPRPPAKAPELAGAVAPTTETAAAATTRDRYGYRPRGPF